MKQSLKANNGVECSCHFQMQRFEKFSTYLQSRNEPQMVDVLATWALISIMNNKLHYNDQVL